MWNMIHATSKAQHARAVMARDRALPIVRSEIKRYQAAYEGDHGKDAGWWQIELGALLQLAADEYVFGDQSKVDAEIAVAVAASKDAPLEVRRAMREEHDARSSYFRHYLWRGLTGKYSAVP